MSFSPDFRSVLLSVMAGLVPAIHAFVTCAKDMDARHKAGHDEGDAGALS
jgi:hypothetical protein